MDTYDRRIFGLNSQKFWNIVIYIQFEASSGSNTLEPLHQTTLGTEESGLIRGVVLLNGWSKMVPRTGWVNTKYRGNSYIHDSSIYYLLH